MTETRPAACVVGYPARHSRSPMLHGYWIKRYGLDADYRAEEVPPGEIREFLTHLADHGYVGCNVTMPHKDVAFELSEPDERAIAVGAANTLWLENSRLRSTNTDIEGFLGALDAAAPGWDQRTSEAIVLGAGGAGRALVYGLIERGIGSIHLVNRTVKKSEAIEVFFGNERILFVDDEKQIVDMGKRMLESLGYHVTIRTSSIEALEVFRAKPDEFDLVVTDQTMPNMVGMELAAELIRIRPDIPIVLATGFSEAVTEEKVKRIGVREFIMKPFVSRELGNIIRRVLDDSKSDC